MNDRHTQDIYMHNLFIVIMGKTSIDAHMEDYDELMDRFVSLLTIIRHDMKNKLQIVVGYLQLLEESDLSADHLILVEKILQTCQKSHNIVDKVGIFKDILLAETPAPEKLSVHINNAVASHRDKADDIEIIIESKLCDEEVYGFHFLEELFANLVENAIIHSRSSKIIISVDQRDNDIVVTVEDDGKGIPRESWDSVFDPGYRGSGSTGSGLGLYIVETIVNKCGGSIKLKESTMGGARFDITLRRA